MTVPDDDVEPEFAFNAALRLWRDGADLDVLGPALREARGDVELLVEWAVERARRPGPGQRSWADIGSALGVSRQAVQKKYGAAG